MPAPGFLPAWTGERVDLCPLSCGQRRLVLRSVQLQHLGAHAFVWLYVAWGGVSSGRTRSLLGLPYAQSQGPRLLPPRRRSFLLWPCPEGSGRRFVLVPRGLGECYCCPCASGTLSRHSGALSFPFFNCANQSPSFGPGSGLTATCRLRRPLAPACALLGRTAPPRMPACVPAVPPRCPVLPRLSAPTCAEFLTVG